MFFVGMEFIQHLIKNYRGKLVEVKSKEKIPLGSWIEALRNKEQTSYQVEDLLRRFELRKINLGISFPGFDVLVIDVDIPEKGSVLELYYEDFEDDYHIDRISTAIVKSGRGGRHYYFRTTPELAKKLESLGAFHLHDSTGRKIEVKAFNFNQYAILPGSEIKQGEYLLLNAGSEELAIIPKELEQQIVANIINKNNTTIETKIDAAFIESLPTDIVVAEVKTKLNQELQILDRMRKNLLNGKNLEDGLNTGFGGRNNAMNSIVYNFGGLYSYVPKTKEVEEVFDLVRNSIYDEFSQGLALPKEECDLIIERSWREGIHDKADNYLFSFMKYRKTKLDRETNSALSEDNEYNAPPENNDPERTKRDLIIKEIISLGENWKNCTSEGYYVTLRDISRNRKIQYDIGSVAFEAFISDFYFRYYNQFPNRNVILDIVVSIRNYCIHHAPVGKVLKRSSFTPYEDGCTIQIGKPYGMGLREREVYYLQVSPKGVEIVTETPHYFSSKYSPNGIPIPQGDKRDIDRLWKYLNVYEEDRILILGYLIGTFLGIGEYPILYFSGSPGMGKSSMIDYIVKIINGFEQEPATFDLERTARDLIANIQNNHIVVMDNASFINKQKSDLLCQLAQGSGELKDRELYSSNRTIGTRLSAAVILASVDVMKLPGDLVDRLLKIEVPELTQEDRDNYDPQRVKINFRNDLPYIIGALCDYVKEGFKNRGTYKGTGRFTLFTSFVADALGDLGNQFLERYKEVHNETVSESADQNIVVQYIVKFMNKKNYWKGTSTQLLEELKNSISGVGNSFSIRNQEDLKQLPKTPEALSRILTENKQGLLDYGILCKKLNRTFKEGKQWELTKLSPGGNNPIPPGGKESKETGDLTNSKESSNLNTCKTSTLPPLDSRSQSSMEPISSMQEPQKEESRSSLNQKDTRSSASPTPSPVVGTKLPSRTSSLEESLRGLSKQDPSPASEFGQWKTSLLTDQDSLFTANSKEGVSGFVVSPEIPAALKSASWISLDIETTNLSPNSRIDPRTSRNEIRVISICYPNGEGIESKVFDIQSFSPGEKKELATNILKDKIVVGTNLGFDLLWLSYFTKEKPKGILDIMMLIRILLPEYVQEKLTREGREEVNLKSIAESFGYTLPQGKEFQKPYNWIGELSQEKYEYCIGDIELPISLLGNLWKELELDFRFSPIPDVHGYSPSEFYQRVQKLASWTSYQLYENSVYDLIQIHHNGLPVDLESINELVIETKEEIKTLAQDVLATLQVKNDKLLATLSDPDKGNTKELTELVSRYFTSRGFQLLGNKSGNSIAIDSLNQSGAQSDPLYNPWVKLSQLKKQIKTLESLKEFADPQGRIHSILSATTSTLRMRSQEPNIQNLPRGEIRRLVKAKEGYSIISMDYSSIEMRIAAALTERIGKWKDMDQLEPLTSEMEVYLAILESRNWRLNLSELFRRGLDAHIATALALMESAKEPLPGDYDNRGNILEWYLEQSPEGDKALKKFVGGWRQRAKAANFGLLYGAGSKKLWEVGKTDYGLSWSEQEAALTRSVWFNAFPEIRLYQLVSSRDSYGVGYSTYFRGTTLSGRRVAVNKFTEINNYQDQGTGAEMILNSIHSLSPELRGYLINSVHDELVFEIPQGKEEELFNEIKNIMLKSSEALLSPWGIPSAVEGGWGKTWMDCK